MGQSGSNTPFQHNSKLTVTISNFGLGGESGGLMIDLVKLENFDMDTTTWQATLGAGHRLGNLDKKLHQHGRALPHGICPGVGIGGHATIVSSVSLKVGCRPKLLTTAG